MDVLGVLIAGLASAGTGALLYAMPWLRRPWRALVQGYTKLEDQDLLARPLRALAPWALACLVNALVLEVMLDLLEKNFLGFGRVRGGDAVFVAVLLGMGYGLTVSAWPAILVRQPWRLWAFNNAVFLLMQAVQGILLGSRH